VQSSNEDGAFDDNVSEYLNHIPFADHGALLDPPSADVTARCVSMLVQLGMRRDEPALAAALAFLYRTQEADGSWYGRWGTNYIYGPWSVLCALNAAGDSAQCRRCAARWTGSSQCRMRTAAGETSDVRVSITAATSAGRRRRPRRPGRCLTDGGRGHRSPRRCGRR
jgi:squalene cyclase